MPKLLGIILIVLACMLPSRAKADSIQTFNMSGTLAAGTFSGTVTIDTTTGNIVSANFAAIVGAQKFTFDGTAYAQGRNALNPHDYTAEFSGTSGANFQLGLPTKSLIGYSGGSICGLPGDCIFSTSALGLDVVTSGQLTPFIGSQATPLSATPEPSSIALLGTGILGLAGALRRKLIV